MRKDNAAVRDPWSLRSSAGEVNRLPDAGRGQASLSGASANRKDEARENAATQASLRNFCMLTLEVFLSKGFLRTRWASAKSANQSYQASSNNRRQRNGRRKVGENNGKE